MPENLAIRIQTARSGRIEPLIPREPLRSSGASWRNLILEKHIAEIEYVRSDLDVHSHLLHIFTGVPVRQDWRVEGRVHQVQNTAGTMSLLPQGLHGSVSVRRSRPGIQWILELALDPAEEALESKEFNPAPQLNLKDRQVRRMVEVLQAEVETGGPRGSLFGEMVGSALVLYLAQRYSSNMPAIGQLRGGMPRLRLNRVLEFIHANLGRELHLEELARAAGLSPFHFAKLFRQSIGSSPHQYVLQQRLEQARELLRNPKISLSEISLRTGFADQSHFTNVFRRFNGITPARFRALL